MPRRAGSGSQEGVMRLVAWTLMLGVACSPDQPLSGRCDDQTLCENVSWCVPGGGCEPPTDCTYAPDGANCNYGSDLGRCSGGRCEEIPSACDGSLDPDEACDGAPVSCTSLDGYHGGTAECRNCTLDVEPCYRVGWNRRATVPTTTIALSLWADGGVAWLGTSDGLYAFVRGAFERVEPGAWSHVAGLPGGDVLALGGTGELLRVPRPGGAPTRTQVAAVPRSLTVIGNEIFIGAKDAVHRASTGFVAEPALGDVYAVHEMNGELYAAGGAANSGRLWQWLDGAWSAIPIDSVPTIMSLSHTGSVLELGTADGWYRLVDGIAVFDPTRVGNRAVPWSNGRFVFDRFAAGAAQYIDANARVASIESPSPVAMTAAAWDPSRRTLWMLDRAGELYTHSGIELARLGSPGVVDVHRLGNDLAVAFDGTNATAPYVTVMPGDGLTASMPQSPPLIATASASTGGAIVSLLSLDRDHHFVAGFLGTSSTIFVYDTTTGTSLPKSWVGPSNMRGFAARGSDVVAVGLGGATRYTGLAGVQTWAPAVEGFPEGIDLRGVTATPDGFVAVGAGGAMFSVSPPNWTWDPIQSGTTADLNAVHSTGDALFASGDGGTVVRCRAQVCAPMQTGTTADLEDVDGRADDLFAVGGGAVLHFDGTAWKAIEIPGFLPSRVAVGETTVWLGEREATSRGLYQMLRVSPL